MKRLGWFAAGLLAAACSTPSAPPAGQVAVQVRLAGSGVGFVNGITPKGFHCEGSCELPVTVPLQLELEAASAQHGTTFLGWAGACSGQDNCQFLVLGPSSVVAAFALPSELVVARVGPGKGRVTSEPAGIDCGADCTEQFRGEGEVTLTAEVEAGHRFAGWEGACSGTGACVVPVGQAALVAARFEVITHRLELAKAGGGTGSIALTPSFPCAAPCTVDVPEGTIVSLRASAGGGSTFSGWSGDCSGTNLCSVKMDGDRSVTATFNAAANTPLTVSRQGTGTGTVTSEPAGIDCGSTCYRLFSQNSTVVLTAVPANGSAFQGWSGAGCSGTGPCSVLMTAAMLVTATFVRTDLLALSPSNASLLPGERLTFTASGGVPPYRFFAGAGVIDGRGNYLAPGTPVTTFVRVEDSLNNGAQATVNVVAAGTNPLSLASTDGRLAIGEQRQLVVHGGAPPFRFSVVSGAGSVDPDTGLASASPTPGLVVFRVTDALNQVSDASYTVVDRFTTPTASFGLGGLTGGRLVLSEDWNRDGRPDLAVTDGLGVATFLQQPDAGWLAAHLTPADAGLAASAFTTGDWNGDGKADLAFAPFAVSGVRVAPGRGDGTFGDALELSASSPLSALERADVDRDGRLDLLAGRTGALDVWLGQPDGGFATAPSTSLVGTPSEFLAGDWNHDGVVDLVVADAASNSLQVLRGLGTGQFIPEPAIDFGAPIGDVATADLNRDGWADLVVTTPADSTVSLLVANGPSRFRLSTAVQGLGQRPNALALGDWNRDGRVDVATFDEASQKLWISRGTGTGLLAGALSEPVGSSVASLLGADLDRDGVSDLAVVTGGSLQVRRGDWGGWSARLGPSNRTAPGDFVSLVAGDFSGDGVDDLLGVRPSYAWWSLGDDRGGLVSPRTRAIDTSLVVLSGDWNRDGQADLARIAGGALLLDFGQRDGGFDTAVTVPGLGVSLFDVVSGDWNRDGRPDFATTDLMSNVKLVSALPDGGWAASGAIDAGLNPLRLQVADWNRDGRDDLAVANQNSNDLCVLLGEGDGGFTLAMTLPLVGSPVDLAVLDWDRDGKQDLAVAVAQSSVVRLYLGGGDGSFTLTPGLDTTLAAGRLATGDWNDDGWADLAVAQTELPAVTVLWGSSDGQAAPSLHFTPALVRAFASGHWSGDGALDLAAAHEQGLTLFLSSR